MEEKCFIMGLQTGFEAKKQLQMNFQISKEDENLLSNWNFSIRKKTKKNFFTFFFFFEKFWYFWITQFSLKLTKPNNIVSYITLNLNNTFFCFVKKSEINEITHFLNNTKFFFSFCDLKNKEKERES